MLKVHKLIAAAVLAAAATPAFALFTVNDTALDGSFSLSPITYGNGAGGAFVTPFLWTSDLAGTAAGPKAYTSGAGIDYSYSFTGNGTSELDFTYHFANTRSTGDLFPNVTGLRF